MDKFDLRILEELDYDSSQPYSKIGKRINRSKQFVLYRIKKLIKNDFIKGFSIDFGMREIGFIIFNILIQLDNISPP